MESEKQIDIESLCLKMKEFLAFENIKTNVSMSEYTSFRAGGKAAAMAVVETIPELRRLLNLLTQEKVPHIILGSGSNILVKDGGYNGIVIKLGRSFHTVQAEENVITAFAGAKISAAAKEAMEHGLSGMEFASGIPGSIGGGVFMNAGAYDGEMKDIILSVRAITSDGTREYSLSGEDLMLGYRSSVFQKNGDIIICAEFQLEKKDKEMISARMKDLMERRNRKQPVNLPSAGSFFKRPEGYFAGKLIQDSGLKGLSVGGAQVSPLHAGFIVNNGNATATDILKLMRLIQNTVFEKFGVRLEPEVRILGD
ncbi:UDP-N-acetylmuramate dehydrogenase [Aminipila luticellarii]|uniref:UDP-N-acetylenolpyruvoylglucosamine reductase n=1 Tax=Aminipila luticellarii TaxID=2507160 RepID=A0A410PUE8_9FIRM|nr:UDP-N-acetylmuramate dehydrogenase [Aminipila luticellarii]QAT42544.1 UDP-N-acetylmuramate dehydrogenase [Aminipila luticellarii]